MRPQFLYFDMGNVLLRFSHERMAEQMSKVAGIPAKQTWKILFEDGLEWSYERGELTREQFYARFCEAAGARPPIEALDLAGNDIFDLNVPIVGLVGRLYGAGYRLGVFSNTSISHWTYCRQRFRFLGSMFPVHCLSYEIGATKPDIRSFRAAEKLAGVPADAIFFADDRPENVAAAQAAGWDAVQFTSVSDLNQAFIERGVLTNY